MPRDVTTFLMFDGTSALPSILGVDAEYRLQEWIGTVTSGISDGAVLLFLAAAVAAAFLVVQLRRPPAGKESDRDPAPGERPGDVGGGR